MQNPAVNERLDEMSSREKQFAMTRRIGDLRVSRTETWQTEWEMGLCHPQQRGEMSPFSKPGSDEEGRGGGR
jgi:hypothetical protein